MAEVSTTTGVTRFGSTERQDSWWLELFPVIVVLGGFGLYATLRAFEGKFYEWGPYISPFYSPLIDAQHHWWPLSPALLILGGPLGFRATCYYYRKAYYRAFFLDPPACAVSESSARKYRGETAHNGLVVGEGSKAIQRMNFGWKRVRPKAHLAEIIVTDDPAFPAPVLTTFGRCGEWKSVLRYVALAKEMLMVYDKFDDTENNPPAEWRFHLHPQWKHAITLPSGTQGFTNERGNRLLCVFYGEFDTANVEEYDFSPSYRVEQKASLVHLTVSAPRGAYEIRIALDPDA